MKELLNTLKAYEEEKEIGNMLYKQMEEEPENEELENKWDESYKKEFELYLSAANQVVKITENKIDFDTAKKMVNMYGGRIISMISK